MPKKGEGLSGFQAGIPGQNIVRRI